MNKTEFARFKRCMEWFCADPDFRARMEKDPGEAASSVGLEGLDDRAAYEAIRWIVFRDREIIAPHFNPYVRASMDREKKMAEHLDSYHAPRACASPKLFAYLSIARERCRTESRLIRQNDHIYYYPFAVELSKGCSVQCSFCGFSAEKHTEDYRYTPENAALFREVIREARTHIGDILGFCPLYFATEPFDNPDYERFMEDYCQITGDIPQTTTAVADRDPERIRRWMARLGEHRLSEHAALRISIRTLRQFRRITALFSPEELADVEFIANNPESIHRCSASGRAAEKAPGPRQTVRYSICCVSGLKVNMTDQTIQFIEPEMPDAESPLGYRVLDSRVFSDAKEFALILEEFDRRYIHGAMPKDLPLCFNKNTVLREEANAWLFTGEDCGYRLGKNPFTVSIIEAIRAGKSFAAGVSPFPLSAEDTEKLYAAVNALYIRGYIRTCK